MGKRWVSIPLVLMVVGCGQTERPKDVLSKADYQQLVHADRSVKQMPSLSQVSSSCQNLIQKNYLQCLKSGLQKQTKIISAAAYDYSLAAKNIKGGCQQELVQEGIILERISKRLGVVIASLAHESSQQFAAALKALKVDVQKIRKTEHPFTCRHQV